MKLRRPHNSMMGLALWSMFLFSCRHAKVITPPKNEVNIAQDQYQDLPDKTETSLPVQDESLTKTGVALPEESGKKTPSKKTELSIVLNYFRYIQSLSDKELQAEFQHTEQEFSKNNAPIHLIRLAMLSGLTRTKNSNTKRALSLLKIYLSEAHSQTPALRDFVFLLSAVIKQNQQQMLKNSKKNKVLSKLKQDNLDLKKIIEALKNIEQNIINKEQ